MWEKELDAARLAAREAGKILKGSFGHVNHIEKKGEIDLLTDADLQAEKRILQVIERAFPLDNIVSEEAGAQTHSSNRNWLIDPMDGTTNFAHGFPFFAVSIGLEVESEVVLGVVYNPLMNEYFEAVKGSGALLNNKPIRTSETKTLGEALLGTGFAYDVHENTQRPLELFRKMLVIARGLRRPGSAALDLCYVAAGRFDGFWEEGLKPWDTAAGVAIVLEAGGKVSTTEGEPYSPYDNSIVAANPFIHDAMIRALNG